MTKAQARAWCRAQKKIIAAWAKEQRLRRLEALKQEVAAKKKRADEECKRKVAGAKAKPKPKKKARKAAPKKKVAKKRAAPRPRKKALPRPRKKAAKPKARKRAPKRKGARKKASRKKATARGAPAARVVERAPAGDAGRLAYAYFLERIREAVRSKGVKRFGEKVFIGSVWNRLRRSEPFKGMSRDEFNRLLVHAHQQGDLRMSRADLVSAMDRKDVDDSLVAHLNATFHFLSPDEVPVVQPVRARSSGFESAFHRAFDRLAAKTRSGLVPLSDMRGALPTYSREQFESGLRRMRKEADDYALQSFEGRHGNIPPAWNDGSIQEGGRRYVYVKRRE